MKKEEDKLYMTHWREMRVKHLHNKAPMCEEWYNDFEAFRTWALGEGYDYDNEEFMFTLQRKDKNKPFGPENCFWRLKGIRQNEKIKQEGQLFSEKQKIDICEEYVNSTISTRDLAKKYNVCQRSIMNVLVAAGITAKSRKVVVKSLPNEEWRLVPGFENKYYVSNLGRVKCTNYKGTGAESLMQPNMHDGYMELALSSKEKTKTVKVHRLVAQLFIPNPNNYPVVNHKNEIRSDNRVENLEWCTQRYNCAYSNAYRVVAINPLTKEEKEYISIQSTKLDGFNPSLVVKCCKGIRQTHGGYVWKYIE